MAAVTGNGFPNRLPPTRNWVEVDVGSKLMPDALTSDQLRLQHFDSPNSKMDVAADRSAFVRPLQLTSICMGVAAETIKLQVKNCTTLQRKF